MMFLFSEELLVRFYPITLDGMQHPHFESPYSIAIKIPTDTSIQLQFLKQANSSQEHFEFMKKQAFKQLYTWLKGIDLSK